MRREVKIDQLLKSIDYQFNDINLLKLALTHRSRGAANYERLEFLGDSILGFVVAEFLYENFPALGEGKLSRMRATLVRRETLAVIARQLELGNHLILGGGELKSGGFNRDSILADTVESIIGAIYLDSDMAHAKQFILTFFSEQLNSVAKAGAFKDAKSRLQEAMQKKGHELPVYEIVEISGDDHDQVFTISCELPELSVSVQASANSRRLAEQEAADNALQELDRRIDFVF